VKIERGKCHGCGRRTATRDGEASDGRPQYRCLDDSCGQTWTNGLRGEEWDTKPSPTRVGKLAPDSSS
jgi:hypothetical protein